MFHELLRIWVDEKIGDQSELLAKYAQEAKGVRDHLHLMAVQKMVYLTSNRLDMLENLGKCYRTRAVKDPDYRRSWEAVNDIEGHEIFIKDLQKSIKKRR